MKLFKLVVLLILIVIINTGCSDRRRSFDGRERFGNMTDEQREQMMRERQKLATQACEGKAEGATCIMESPRGSSEGTCMLQDDKLLCVFEIKSRPVR